MEILILVVFVVGYACIAFEQRLGINKTATALVTGVLCWVLYAFSGFQPIAIVESELAHHIGEIAGILFFLLAAMTIVELIDAYNGFNIITDKISTSNPKKLLWIICILSFFLSAILDNLTTSIVMVSLIRKLIPDKSMRWLFAGMIIIAANAGGAWSPVGDVTTTMLWMGGQISATNTIIKLFLPSVVSLLVPLLYLQATLNKHVSLQENTKLASSSSIAMIRNVPITIQGSKTILLLGIGGLISVPIFKTVTHLPPYLGILLALGVLWIITELTNPHLDEEEKRPYTAAGALERIDVPSILFFLGILLAVGALEVMGTLLSFSSFLDSTIGDQRIIITLIGLLSAIVDNVPLVAASMGMYSLEVYPQDNMIWEYLAYCAGTGGSILIIGSAAGVAAMGMEKIDFVWYIKKISLLALLGYFAGAICYLLMWA